MDRAEAIEVLENGNWWDSLDVSFDILDPMGAVALHDAIDMAIAALREQDVPDINIGNKWISVEERLPEDDVDVLTRRATGMSVESHCGFGWLYDEYNGRWVVTHWMPLTEPPEVVSAKMQEEGVNDGT